MPDLITKCPSCAISFHVREILLKPAKGQVRCGNCQQQFNALEHAIAKKNIPAATVLNDAADRDELLIYDDMPMEETPVTQPEGDKIIPTQIPSSGPEGITTLLFEPGQPLETPRGAPGYRIGLSIGILVLLVLLGLQYAHFNAVKLSTMPTLGPLTQQLCNLTGCNPVFRDLEQLVIRNLVISSHPERDNALRITGQLGNLSKHPQAYPDILIQFEGIEGEIVASRAFIPREYLPNSPNGQDLQSRQKVNFQLDIVDPGESAQGYSIKLQ